MCYYASEVFKYVIIYTFPQQMNGSSRAIVVVIVLGSAGLYGVPSET